MEMFPRNQSVMAMTARASRETSYFAYRRRRRPTHRRTYGRLPRRGPSLWGWMFGWRRGGRRSEWKMPQIVLQSIRESIPVVARALRAAAAFVLTLGFVLAVSALRAVGMVAIFFLLINWRGYLRWLVDGIVDAWAAFVSSYWHGDAAAPTRR